MAQELSERWFSDEWGWERCSGSATSGGRLYPQTGGEDSHHTGIAGSGFKSLEEGQKVTYEATQGRKGMQAENVTPA